MNFLKATVATAAVITCCMGNEYPAQAQLAFDDKGDIDVPGTLYDTGFSVGAAFGAMSVHCTQYHYGVINHDQMVQSARWLAEQDKIAAMGAFNVLRDKYEDKISMAMSCFPVVKSVFNAIHGS